ncbi:MAG: hypothetical protein R3C14_17575 [Caldilineaceae bacterium]
MTYQLPLEIIHEEELWMARCAAIQGFLSTGETLDQLLHEVPTIIQSLYDVCREKGWTFIKDAPNAQPNDIVWVVGLPHPILQVA